MRYLTRGLLETLLRFARERDPDDVTIPLAVTRARELSDLDAPNSEISAETPVFTHFYFPSSGDSLDAVFGIDLGTPAAQTPGIFVSHPRSELRVTKYDELRETVFVAVPPWEEDSFRAFDRHGTRLEHRVLDVDPPTESLPE